MLGAARRAGRSPRPGGPRAGAQPGVRLPSGSSRSRSPIRPVRYPCSTGWTWSSRRRGGGAGRRERRRQEHGGGAAARAARARRAVASRLAGSTWLAATSSRGGARSPGCPSTRRCCAAAWPTTSGSAIRPPRDGRVREAAAAGRRPCVHRARCRMAIATLVGDGRTLTVTRRAPPYRPRPRVSRDAPLVILDEPTADLDAHSVAVVSDAVGRLRAGRTVLLIAHRPELVRHADRVVLLVDGAAMQQRDRRAA